MLQNERGQGDGGMPPWIKWALIIGFIKNLPRIFAHAKKHGWGFVVLGFIGLGILADIAPAIGVLLLVGGVCLFVRKLRINWLEKNRIQQEYLERVDPSTPVLMRVPAYNAPFTKKGKQVEPYRIRPEGFFFGVKDGGAVVKPESEDGHILVVGGPGSGKSSAIAIPTLRAWQGRVFVIDIKGELLDKSLEYRDDVKAFNPAREDCCGYDPYIFLRASKNKAQEARAIAHTLITVPPNTDPFWHQGAQSLLTACILHFSYTHTFMETITEILTTDTKEMIKDLSDSHDNDTIMCMGGFSGMSEKTFSSIFLILKQAVEVLATNQSIVSALSREYHVVSPMDFENGIDIYIQPPEHSIEEYGSLLALMTNQFLRYFRQRKENSEVPILFMIDEFANIGKIPIINQAMATLRSKNITICLMVQGIRQIDNLYGSNERSAIVDNCSYVALLRANDTESQKYFSEMIGTYKKQEFSETENYIVNTSIRTSESMQQTERDEIRAKPHTLAYLTDILLVNPFKDAIRVGQARYYETDKKGIFTWR